MQVPAHVPEQVSEQVPRQAPEVPGHSRPIPEQVPEQIPAGLGFEHHAARYSTETVAVLCGFCLIVRRRDDVPQHCSNECGDVGGVP